MKRTTARHRVGLKRALRKWGVRFDNDDKTTTLESLYRLARSKQLRDERDALRYRRP